jgi:hypothetical protein
MLFMPEVGVMDDKAGQRLGKRHRLLG